MARSVRNMKNSLERWGKSDEVAELKELIKKTKNGIHIDQEGMHVITDEADDIEHEY